MRFILGRHARRVLVLSFGLIALAAGIAYSTIPDSAGVIHGCYRNNGQLRVIDPSNGGACKNNETGLDWSQTGPQGPPGQDGTDGTNGTNGTNGVSGYELVSDTGPLPGGDPGTGQINSIFCPAGKKVTGGGITVGYPQGGHFALSVIRESGPVGNGRGWSGFIQRTDDDNDHVEWTLWAICASVS
jgi:hypothetical protein